MVNPVAEQIATVKYEHPLNEKMRVLLRIEFLWSQIAYSLKMESETSCIMALHNLLALLELNERYDLKSEAIKFLDKLIVKFYKIHKQPNIDEDKLEDIIHDLTKSLNRIKAVVGKVGSALSTNEWLSTIKQKILLPGGLSSCDLPFLHYWQKFPLTQKIDQLTDWKDAFAPLVESTHKILYYTRKTSYVYNITTMNGNYHKIIEKHLDPLLISVEVPKKLNIYPEISGNPSRIAIRFLQTDLVHKASLFEERVDFKLSICW